MLSKYPRTYHLTFSKGCSNDDKKLENNDYFLNKNIVITSKLDGSNFCMTNESCFSRSHNGPPKHQSFDWAKSFHNQIKHIIPENLAIYAEYVFAQHSINYTDLPHYIFIFNILNVETNQWLSWKDVEIIAAKISVPTVPVLFEGVISNNNDLEKLTNSFMKQKEFVDNEREGIVIRLADSFDDKDFDKCISKAVRLGHVQTDQHWAHQQIIKNKLK